MIPKKHGLDAKRLIGRNFQRESVQADMHKWPFKVIEDQGKARRPSRVT